LFQLCVSFVAVVQTALNVKINLPVENSM